MKTALPLFAALCFTLASQPAQAAYEFYVKVEGVKQGVFKGSLASGKIPGLSFHYNVKSPRDSATGQASGKRTHHPVTFVKEWGASTPQFFQALTTNEVLSSVTFEFVRNDEKGNETVYHVIRLVNATVSEIDQSLGADSGRKQGGSNAPELEKISFTFQRIEIQNNDGKTIAVDDWN